MTYVRKRWHLAAIFLLGLVGGPSFLYSGFRSLDRGSTLSTIGGWFMVVGGVFMVLGGALALIGLLRRRHSE
jgi:hypothetical protein